MGKLHSVLIISLIKITQYQVQKSLSNSYIKSIWRLVKSNKKEQSHQDKVFTLELIEHNYKAKDNNDAIYQTYRLKVNLNMICNYLQNNTKVHKMMINKSTQLHRINKLLLNRLLLYIRKMLFKVIEKNSLIY